MHSSPRVIAVARDYDQLITAIRARRDELQVTHITIDEVAGLQGGYAGKLLCDPPIKLLGKVSFGCVLGALGLAVVLVQDNDALKKVQDRLVTRKHRKMRPDRSHTWFTAENAREMAKRRAAKMSAKERSASASKAARARWRKPRLIEITPAK
jgi:hypothetical protein